MTVIGSNLKTTPLNENHSAGENIIVTTIILYIIPPLLYFIIYLQYSLSLFIFLISFSSPFYFIFLGNAMEPKKLSLYSLEYRSLLINPSYVGTRKLNSFSSKKLCGISSPFYMYCLEKYRLWLSELNIFCQS